MNTTYATTSFRQLSPSLMAAHVAIGVAAVAEGFILPSLGSDLLFAWALLALGVGMFAAMGLGHILGWRDFPKFWTSKGAHDALRPWWAAHAMLLPGGLVVGVTIGHEFSLSLEVGPYCALMAVLSFVITLAATRLIYHMRKAEPR